LFKWIPKQSNSEYVFPSPSGERWSCNQKAFRHARSRAGLVDLHFHDLRHTFASHFIMSGGDIYALRGILGHKSITMTQRYAHLSPAYQRAMLDRMEAVWAKPPAAMDKAPVSPRPRPSRRRIPEAHQVRQKTLDL
jgi:site-specific recombinase XerD